VHNDTVRLMEMLTKEPRYDAASALPLKPEPSVPKANARKKKSR